MERDLAVVPGTLRTCAGHGQTIAEAVGGLAAQATDACAQAAGPHDGWTFGTTLSALAPLWRKQLTEQGTAVSGAAQKLRDSADGYTAAENANTDRVRSALSPAGAGT